MKYFSTVRQKLFHGKSWYPALLCIKFFSLPEVFSNTEWFSGEVFPVLWGKKVSTKLWSFPLPLLEIFRYQNSFETQRCSPTNFIGTVRQYFFNGVYWHPLLMQKILRCTKFSETPKCSPTKNFGTVRQKLLNEKSSYPLFCIKYRNRNFS